jgi:hypothetical protein
LNNLELSFLKYRTNSNKLKTGQSIKTPFPFEITRNYLPLVSKKQNSVFEALKWKEGAEVLDVGREKGKNLRIFVYFQPLSWPKRGKYLKKLVRKINSSKSCNFEK